MGGVSGAFLLLPFQMSVLGFVNPSVSPTNLVYNIVAIPSGVYRYIKEGRMAWPLAWVIIVGTLPGVFMGAIIRIKYLPDPKNFKFFVGCVLLYIGIRLLLDLTKKAAKKKMKARMIEERFKERSSLVKKGLQSGPGQDAVIKTISFSLTRYSYEFYGETFAFNTAGLFALALILPIAIATGVSHAGEEDAAVPVDLGIPRLDEFSSAYVIVKGTPKVESHKKFKASAATMSDMMVEKLNQAGVFESVSHQRGDLGLGFGKLCHDRLLA